MNTATTWRRTAQTLAIAALGIGLGASVSGQETPVPAGRGGSMGRGGGMLERLQLTDQQRTDLRALRAEHVQEMTAARQQLREANEALRKAIFASATPDEGSIGELVDRVAELEKQQLQSRVAMEMKVAGILTDEQRQQLASAPARPMRGRPGARLPR